MSLRARQSTAPAPSQSSRAPTLPEYEPPQFPPNAEAQRALADLSKKAELRQLDAMISKAQSRLTNVAADVNDRLFQFTEESRKRGKESSQAEDGQDQNEVEQDIEQLKEKVDRMTDRMEATMRKLIDGQYSVQFIKESLATVHTDARNNASTQASTQNLRTQRRGNRDTQGEEEGDEDNLQDFTPTDPDGGTQAMYKPSEIFTKKLDDKMMKWQSFEPVERYGENNDYIKFKRLVHDARYPKEDVALEPPRQWFGGGGQAPGLGVTRGDESDDDIQISRATTSTKCPITLQEFKDPLTSKKCPHSFESSAIMEMIRLSTLKVGTHPGPRGQNIGGEKAVQCPVQSCSNKLTKEDLFRDELIVRKIQRLQRAKQLQEENGESDGEQGQSKRRRTTMLIDDDDDDAADVDDFMDEAPPVKKEPRGTMKTPTATTGTASRSTQPIDLGSSDEEE